VKYILSLFIICVCCSAKAQENAFKSSRFDENYATGVSDSAKNWYDKLKFSPLNKDKSIYISFGGEVRYQYFRFKNQDWGEAPIDKDGFILSRLLGHLHFHAGKHWRAFVQLQSSLASGEVETPSPIDQNPLEMHQGFIDFSSTINKDALVFRFGRQELSYGSQRLIAVREAPNNRQSFDAVKGMFSAKNVKLDVFYGYYVNAKPEIFDDVFNRGTKLWGAYAVINKLPLLGNLDVYYLGIDKNAATFNEGKGKEQRHSLGGRLWRSSSPFQYDIESLYQFGKFNGNKIAAWTLSANLSYSFNNTYAKPKLGLKTEMISGDRKKGDGKLNTFNPLFPKGAYFGLAALIGPYNLIDAHPYLELSLNKKMAFAIDYDLFYRMSREDGLYAVNGRLIYPSSAGTSKKIGGQLGAEFSFTVSKYFSLRQELTWFMAGDFLKEAGPGKNILMTGSTATLKF